MDTERVDRLKAIKDGTIGRGMLTTDVDKIAKIFLERSITKTELRLIPYIQYVMCNERKINPVHINQEEREILSQWKKEGHIEGGASGLAVTKHFWDFMCEVLFVAYVGYDNEEYFISDK